MVEATEAKLVNVLEDSIWHSEQVNPTLHGAAGSCFPERFVKLGIR
jgi:hypothetical protein